MSTTQNNTNNRTKRYSFDFKNQVLEELRIEGAYAVSKKHGISNSQIHKWKKALTEKWSKSTKLGNAARYILRHYDKLTLFLDFELDNTD